jgi:hypothetical protein
MVISHAWVSFLLVNNSNTIVERQESEGSPSTLSEVQAGPDQAGPIVTATPPRHHPHSHQINISTTETRAIRF